MNEDLRKWFGKGKEGDWVRVGTDGKIKGDCAREPGEGKPKCMPRSKAHSMGKDDRATAARRKRREDPVADRKGKGNKPVMVNTEEFMMEGNEPTNPSLWSKAKSLAKQKFDVYPSAYANGWAAKYYKSKGGGWKSVSEEAIDEKCWDGYKRVGMKKKGKRMVPNCVPEATDIIAKAKAANQSARDANPYAKRHQDAIDKRNASIKRSAEARRRMLHPDTEERKRIVARASKPSGYSTNAAGYSTSDRYKSVKEELGKNNEWGTDALRQKYAAMTPGQESLSADKIPSFDPRYDDVTTQHLGLHPFREGYLAEISARGAEARAKFQAKVRQTLADPKNIARAKKTLAKKKEAEKAKEAPHLVMQLRKAVSIGSKVHFQDGQHHAISSNHADIFMSKYNSAKSSIEKEALQKRAHKSHTEFMRTIAEDHSPDCEPMDNMGTHHVDSYEAHRGSGDQISPVISHDDEDIRFQDFDETAFEKELEADVLSLSWDDLVDLYDEDEIEYDESPEEEGEDLEEGITPAGRLKKKFNAMRSKSRRMMARNIAIKRVSSPEKLKSRSIRAARRMVYKRLLRNRDISTVSSSEKTRLEAQIKRMAPMVARLSVRVMPAVRKLEQSRIKNSRTRKKK